MEITYLGHSAFLIEDAGIKALIDPFLSGNQKNINDFSDINYIFVTHGHGDHIGDTIGIAQRDNAKVICNFDLGQYFASKGLNVHLMHIGGKAKFPFGTVKMTNALHGSGISTQNGLLYGGNPGGFLININGKKLYHAGDTGLTLDMKLLEDEKVDVACLPIGGNFTMDAEDAAKAVEFIKPEIVIPMHYNTFKPIETDPMEFKRLVKNAEVKILGYKESIEI